METARGNFVVHYDVNISKIFNITYGSVPFSGKTIFSYFRGSNELRHHKPPLFVFFIASNITI